MRVVSPSSVRWSPAVLRGLHLTTKLLLMMGVLTLLSIGFMTVFCSGTGSPIFRTRRTSGISFSEALMISNLLQVSGFPQYTGFGKAQKIFLLTLTLRL